VVRLVRGWIAVLFASAAAASGGALACLLELEHRVACGDGFVDPDAGEQCDPADPSSYEGACLDNGFGGGVGDCHATECTIVASLAQCVYCGDGRVTERHPSEGDTDTDGPPAEECDEDNFDGVSCPGDGVPTCNDDCTIDMSSCLPYCGDGEILDDEECEPEGGIATPRSCAGDETTMAISSPYGSIHEYGSGVTVCTQCRWPRGQCSYCGNGTLDEALSLDNNGLISPAEKCDGDQFDKAALSDSYGDACEKLRSGSRPNVGCASGCYDFIAPPVDAPCCIESGAVCPDPEEDFECCYAFAHPEDRQPCNDNGGILADTCK